MRRFLAALSFVAACFGQNAAESKVKQLTADELKQLLERKDVFYLDVREPKELEELGTVKGYVNIPLGQIEQRLNEIPKDKVIVTL